MQRVLATSLASPPPPTSSRLLSIDQLTIHNLHLIDLSKIPTNDLPNLPPAVLLCLWLHPAAHDDLSLVERACRIFKRKREIALEQAQDTSDEGRAHLQLYPSPPSSTSRATNVLSPSPTYSMQEILPWISDTPVHPDWDLKSLTVQIDYIHLLDLNWNLPHFPLPPPFFRRHLQFEPNRPALPVRQPLIGARKKERAGRRAGTSSNAEVSQEEAEYEAACFIYGTDISFEEFAFIRDRGGALYAYVQAFAAVRRLFFLLEGKGGDQGGSHPSFWVQFLSRSRKTLLSFGPGLENMNADRVKLAEIMQDRSRRMQIIRNVPPGQFDQIARPVYECATSVEWQATWIYHPS